MRPRTKAGSRCTDLDASVRMVNMVVGAAHVIFTEKGVALLSSRSGVERTVPKFSVLSRVGQKCVLEGRVPFHAPHVSRPNLSVEVVLYNLLNFLTAPVQGCSQGQMFSVCKQMFYALQPQDHRARRWERG